MDRPWVKLWSKTIDDEKIRFVIKRYGHDCWTVFTAMLMKSKNGVLELDQEVFADSLFIEEARFQEIKKILSKYDLICIDEEGRPFLPKWDLYQGTQDEIEAIRFANSQRQKRFRESKKSSNVTDNVTVTTGNVSIALPVTLSNAIELEGEVELEEEAEKREGEQPAKPSAPVRNPEKKSKYGKFQNVLLTDAELSRLIDEFPNSMEAIDYLSNHRKMKGYKARDDNLAIRKWVFTALREEKLKGAELAARESRAGGQREWTTEEIAAAFASGGSS